MSMKELISLVQLSIGQVLMWKQVGAMLAEADLDGDGLIDFAG